MPAQKHVALLLDTSTSWGTDLICGIMTYARKHTRWVVHFEPRGKYEVMTPPRHWRGQGIISRVTTRDLAEYIGALGLAAVNVSWYRHDTTSTRIAHCTTDVQQAGRICAAHFLDRGFRHFAYCGAVHRPHYDDELMRSYCAALQERGYSCAKFESKSLWHRSSWQIEYEDLTRWLLTLPKPSGLLAFDAVRGRQITEVCRGESIPVPESIAVLAGEHDRLCTETSVPPLSSLDISPRLVGYQAAKILDRLLQGLPYPEKPVWIPPGRVATRQSTDTLAVDDPDVASAIRFIHQHASESIQVKDLLQGTRASRRVLEQKFKSLLGRTPAAEIRRRKIELVKGLLEDTDLPLASIAARTGFRYVEVLTRTFQRETGMAPSVYRGQVQGDAEERVVRVDAEHRAMR
jgi:LacI family transcriptional regulator